MGAETQLSLLMAVNHDKLSIKYFLQKLKKVTLQFCKAGSGIALRNQVHSDQDLPKKKNADPHSTALKKTINQKTKKRIKTPKNFCVEKGSLKK